MTTIPAQYRLTFKEQNEHIRNEDGTWTVIQGTPLGFANVYEPNTKGYLKRRKTQDEWAYGGYSQTYREEGGVTWIKGTKSHWNGKNHVSIPFDEPVADILQPRIVDNVPLEGFKIVKSVSRSTTDNKVWRILDPRGFELEIYTSTMEHLLLTGTVDRGEIGGRCLWLTPKQLVRIDENGEVV